MAARLLNKAGWIAAGVLALLLIAALAGVVLGGPLDPPAPPGGTQGAQINSLPFTIGTPGSYVFTRSLTGAAGSNGITVTAADVSIDMRGFALIGPGGTGTEVGIVGSAGARLSVRNGTIRNWAGSGLTADSGQFANLTFDHVGTSSSIGVDLSSSTVSDCVVQASGSSSGTTTFALRATTGSTVTHCQFYNNPSGGLKLEYSAASNIAADGNGKGIVVSNASTLTDSASTGNTGDGVQVAAASTVTGTTANGNSGNGIMIIGTGNRIADNNLSYNNQAGVLGSGTNSNTVTGNTVVGNVLGGIDLGGADLVSGNHVDHNGAGGIHSAGTGETIQDNTVTNNGSYGIWLSGGSNQVTRNNVAWNGGVGIQLSAGNDSITNNNVAWNGRTTPASEGISAEGPNTLIENNSVSSNSGDGIYLHLGEGQVSGNTVTHNAGNGIYVSNGGSRIEGNHAEANVLYGIMYYGGTLGASIVVRNSALKNTSGDYHDNGGANDAGPLGTAASGTSPWANIDD